MTFEYVESSRKDGHPIDLYLFVYGESPGQHIAYTNADQAFVYDAGDGRGEITYAPEPIARGSFSASGNLDKAEMEVRTARDSTLAVLMNDTPPSFPVALLLRQGHLGDDDFKTVWAGRVLSHRFVNSEAIFSCESIHTQIRKPGLRRNYQRGCPHLLYGPRCRADRTAATAAYPVVAVNGPLVTLEENWAVEAVRNSYTGGVAEWTAADGRAERRRIVRIEDETTILLSASAATLPLPGSITLVKGCSHILEKVGGVLVGDCADVHNNTQNYGGHLFIPSTNPIGVKNSFY